jgi:hypothetical protein
MAIVNGAPSGGGGGAGSQQDEPLVRIWGTIAELSEQLSGHRAAAAELQAQISMLKVSAPLDYEKGGADLRGRG